MDELHSCIWLNGKRVSTKGGSTRALHAANVIHCLNTSLPTAKNIHATTCNRVHYVGNQRHVNSRSNLGYFEATLICKVLKESLKEGHWGPLRRFFNGLLCFFFTRYI